MVLPDRHDPRLRLAAVITTLQVLGQTVLGFKLSIAQILVSIAVCGGVEIAVTLWRRHALVWPASAILTGNSTAFILRTNGTQPGDWWSLNGIEFFIAAGLIGVLSKYVIRPGGRHIYNPSNLGLVVVLLLAGPTRVFPQYLWWGPVDTPVILAWAVILIGGFWVLRSLGMLPMVFGFFLIFPALIAVFAGDAFHCFDAVWRSTPVCGTDYWLGIAASPELAIFVLLMMSDPKTAPAGTVARAIYGFLTAVVAAALIFPQPSEWGIKVALLAGLTIVCSFVPLLQGKQVWSRSRLPARVFAFLAAVVITVGTTLGLVAASANADVRNVDHPGAPGTPRSQG